MKNTLKRFVMAAILVAIPVFANTNNDNNSKPLAEKVRKELVMLPWLSIYDNLSFRIDGDTVTLFGSTIRPTLKSSAANVVKKVEGVNRVVNEIEVLPLSPFDDRIRIATARAIYGYAPLQRYGLGANPSIRIIVKNGNVSLQGVVASEMDRNLAFMRANGVFGSFTVTNDLRIDNR
jgi:hyperosmotically inducible periplasmic protein